MKARKKVAREVEWGLRVLALLVVGWFVVANIVYGVEWGWVGIVAAVVGVGALVVPPIVKRHKEAIRKFMRKPTVYYIAVAVVALVGVGARLSFLQYAYSPDCACDPGTFYWNAESLAENGKLHAVYGLERGATNEQYFAFYPYEMGYTGVLAVGNVLFGGGHISVILVNLVFDLIGGVLMMLLARKLFPERKWLWLMAGGVYFLNPFNVVFSVLSLPIVAVNAFIVAVMYVAVVAMEKLKQPEQKWQSALMFALLGGLMGVGNWYRPVFVIMLIAAVLLLGYLKLRDEKMRWGKMLVGLVAMVVAYVLCGQVNYTVVDNVAGMRAARSASGWSLYVGSNTETSGRWLPDSADLGVRRELWAEHGDNMQAVHDELGELAMERYRENGLWENVKLYANKALVAGGDQAESMYNTEVLVGYGEGAKAVVDGLAEVFILTLFVMMGAGIWMGRKSKKPEVWVGLELLLLGFFMSGLLVEVKNRYFTVLLPVMILMAVGALAQRKKKR